MSVLNSKYFPGVAASFSRNKERFVLGATDVTNGYVQLAQQALPFSITAGLQGLGLLEESVDGGTTGDYVVSVVGGKSRLTWKNDFATGGAAPLAAGAAIYVHYSY